MVDNSKLITLLVGAGLTIMGSEAYAAGQNDKNLDSMSSKQDFSIGTISDLKDDLNDTNHNGGCGNSGCGNGACA